MGVTDKRKGSWVVRGGVEEKELIIKERCTIGMIQRIRSAKFWLYFDRQPNSPFNNLFIFYIFIFLLAVRDRNRLR